MDVFVPYGRLHAITLAVCLLAIAAPALIGRALDRRGEMILRGSLAALAVCYWLAYTTWWNWHGLELRTGLPLQVCDVNGLIAPLALMSGWRYVRATLYFWTAALTLQAFIQPALTAGPTSLLFWAFWVARQLRRLRHRCSGLSPLLERSRPRPDRERRLCRPCGADQRLARLQL